MQQTDNAKKNVLFSKLVVIALLVGVSWVPTFFVLEVVIDRSSRADGAMSEIATKWSREQTVHGPILTIPTKTAVVTASGERTFREELIFLVPETVTYDVSLDTEVLSRGIFDAGVYSSNIKGDGTFNLNNIDLNQISGTIQWSDATLSIGIPDTRGIGSEIELAWNENRSAFEPGVSTVTLGQTGISAPVQINRNRQENAFSFELPLRGSEGINFVPFGKTTNVSITSDWPSPSFSGEFLPKERELNETGFTATWAVSSFGRSIPQSWVGTESAPNQTVQENMRASTFGVALHQDADFYTQVNRSVKYSILFIALTFLSFFMFEALAKLRIHPMSYLFVGLAIAIFYLLLLSLSENIGFLSAYIASTIAVTGLITGYCRSILKAKKELGL
jgi:inner membrane protein